ncbi:MAG: hypothetical protein ACI8XO_002495 [Verrucomicrobiales bacterium]|jgi:hypothetical protein
MNLKKSLFFTALLLPVGSASAAVIASTNFDGHTLPSTNTAGTLNWTLDGVDDPGDMSAFNAAAGPQALFDGNVLVKNLFIPGINTGNGNTFWTTTVNLTVASGSTVALSDVTFNYWAVNGGQNENVGRRSDFTVTLISPTATLLEAVTVADVIGGNTVIPNDPLVTATFTAPISLTAPGTYTLEIKGGDFVGFNETGNHTGIDNLSINGVVGTIPEPSSVMLVGLGLVGLVTRRRR